MQSSLSSYTISHKKSIENGRGFALPSPLVINAKNTTALEESRIRFKTNTCITQAIGGVFFMTYL